MARKATGDLAAFGELARSMRFSSESCDWFRGEATAGQLRMACALIEHGQRVRERRKRERLFRKAAFPQLKSFEGYDFSQVSLPEGYGRDDLASLDLIEHAQDLAFHGRTGRGKAHLAIAAGAAAVSAGKAVRFFGTAGLMLSRWHSS